MQSFRDLSIKRKLTLIIMLTSSIALLLSCAALMTYDRLSSERALVRRISTTAEIIGFNSTVALSLDDPSAAAETLSALRVEPHVVAASIYTRDDQVFATYQREDQPFTPPPPQTDGHYFAIPSSANTTVGSSAKAKGTPAPPSPSICPPTTEKPLWTPCPDRRKSSLVKRRSSIPICCAAMRRYWSSPTWTASARSSSRCSRGMDTTCTWDSTSGTV